MQRGRTPKSTKRSAPRRAAKATRTGLDIPRVYTTPDAHPFDLVEWATRDSVIKEKDGSVVFEMKGVEAPKDWSQLATDIAASKYFRKAGLGGDPTRGETSVRQLVSRVADTIASEGFDRGYFRTPEDAEAFRMELTHMLVNQIGAFNSPVWFNVGLYHRYGIPGSGGQWAWDHSRGAAFETVDGYSRPQASACFLQSLEDSLVEEGGIYDLLKNEGRLFKYGSGTGSNFSRLRGKQEKLSGGGTSSGLMSFLEVFDRAAGSTKSGGTTRRAAKMVCLDMDHPEIREFIGWKAREEKKAQALIAAGYDSDLNGEAYHTVSGQNSNNSVRVTDEFMLKATGQDYADGTARDRSWPLKARTTGEALAVVDARELWDSVAQAAWECADPGVQYHTTTNRWNTCKNSGDINCSNPCAEFVYLDDTACNLSSLNLTKFLRFTPEGSPFFDVARFKHAVRVFFVAQEILVDLASYPTKKICENSYRFRPLGLGYANLGTLLTRAGIAYDSPQGRGVASGVTALMTGWAYRTSAEMARALGPFPGFAENRDCMLDVMRLHQDALADKQPDDFNSGLAAAAETAWEEVFRLGTLHGYRNAQATLLAPTGTIGLLMDCDTTGVEPTYALFAWKKYAGGGGVEIVNQSVPRALASLGYATEEAGEIQAYVQANKTFEGSALRAEHLPVFDCAVPAKRGGRFLPVDAHLKMMAAVQPFLSGAISKTVNLPEDATVDDVRDAYLKGWLWGLKAVALYRDNCKKSQPLNVVRKEEAKGGATVATFAIGDQQATVTAKRHKLPKKRKGVTQEARVGGHKIFLRTGEYPDGTVGEIFIDMHKEGAAFRSLMACFARAVSIGLQYGVPLEAFVKHFTFTRFEPQGSVEGHPNIKLATSIVDWVFRFLGVEYLARYDLAHVKPEEESATPLASVADVQTDAPPCDVCGHTTVRNGACYKCNNCGNSMGCS